jgi:hypothetical protein
MHDALDLRGDHATVAPLHDGQRIHVGPQHEGRTWLAAVEIGEDAGPSDTRPHREAEAGAALRDEVSSVVFLE